MKKAAMFSNSRNGTTPKAMKPQIGDIELDVPRDREGPDNCTYVARSTIPGEKIALMR